MATMAATTTLPSPPQQTQMFRHKHTYSPSTHASLVLPLSALLIDL